MWKPFLLDHGSNVIPIGWFIASIIFGYNLGKWCKKIVNEQKKIYKSEKERFIELFEGKDDNVNYNIHPDLYCYEKMQEYITKSDKTLEEDIWKTRILYGNTIQGNVIMYYDLYKQAFAYFSDNNISYSYLNECAMKYVRIFFCRDFFVDTEIIPKHIENPFNKMKLNEDKKELEKKKEKREALKLDLNSNVFMKKKKPNVRFDPKTVPINKDEKENNIEKEKKIRFANNFRHMGKIQNYSFLQKVNLISKHVSLGSPSENKIISQDYQYIEFKNRMKTNKRSYEDLCAD